MSVASSSNVTSVSTRFVAVEITTRCDGEAVSIAYTKQLTGSAISFAICPATANEPPPPGATATSPGHAPKWQVASQPSPSVVLPSSQSSPRVTTSLPQRVSRQLSQPSPSTRLPSSQSSPAVTTPLPQPVGRQLWSQPSPSTRLPSSQPSPAVTTPLPQPVGRQLWSQPSPSTRLPSSHSTLPSRRPSPHTAHIGNPRHSGSSQSATPLPSSSPARKQSSNGRSPCVPEHATSAASRQPRRIVTLATPALRHSIIAMDLRCDRRAESSAPPRSASAARLVQNAPRQPLPPLAAMIGATAKRRERDLDVGA